MEKVSSIPKFQSVRLILWWAWNEWKTLTELTKFQQEADQVVELG